MGEPIAVAPGVYVPASALRLRTARASGPGGQNVNKVATKVELRVDLGQVQGLDAAARARLLAQTERRRDAHGLLVVASQRTRDQRRNLEDAREKIRALVARCLLAPRPRRPTRATAASHARRLAEKRRAGARKRDRAAARAEED